MIYQRNIDLNEKSRGTLWPLWGSFNASILFLHASFLGIVIIFSFINSCMLFDVVGDRNTKIDINYCPKRNGSNAFKNESVFSIDKRSAEDHL
jgi:hypothetical protein